MNRSPSLASASTLTALAVLLVCPGVARAQDPMAGMMHHGTITIPAGAIYTVPDVEFMQGMIAHHAQAIYMSDLAKSRHARSKVLTLATKIAQSQLAEIRIMQGWLKRNGQVVPDTSSWRTMTMPGMLTAAQLDSLEAATGTEFDRAYLDYMIQHHEGALQMVKDLLAHSGSAQDVDVSVFANDVVTVQTAQIGAMLQMLSSLPGD